MSRTRAVLLTTAALLVGGGVGGYVIAQAAGSVANAGTMNDGAVQAATTSPNATPTHPCPNMGGSSSSSSSSGA